MGGGNFGGFSNTKEALSIKNAPVSTPGDVKYDNKKMEEYLLNTKHPQGKSKAKFLHDVLGYNQGDGKSLHKNIVSSIIGKIPIKTVETKFGTKHTYHTKLIGKSGKLVSANVVVVIQKDSSKTKYKIVTLYPDKKEGKK